MRVLVDSPADFVRGVARPGDYDVVVIDPLVDPETTRSAAFARDCRRLLTAGGLYVVAGVSAPAFFGPGSGRAELEAWKEGIAEAFGKEHVATERAGPPAPWFPRATLIVATKALDPEVASKLFDECVLGHLHGVTRVLVTNRLDLAQRCDRLVLLDFGMTKHVPDAHMPADFLTKWITQAKFNTSVQYATGSLTKPPAVARGGPQPDQKKNVKSILKSTAS